MVLDTEKLIAVCKNHKNTYIYGAGKNADRVYHFLLRKGIRIKGFIVTDMTGNPEELFGIEVMTIDRLPEKSDYIILVPFIRTNKVYKEILDHLAERGIHNVYFFSGGMLESIREELLVYKVKDIFNADPYRYGEDVPVEILHSILAMRDKDGTEYHWRFRNQTVEEQKLNGIRDIFPDKSALEEFEEQYGKYHVFRLMDKSGGGPDGTYSVYMARSHADKFEIKGKLPLWPVPIQAGAALTEQNICNLKDNMGENISDKNTNYSECTAIYWMWKNAPRTDYIGLCHYRRHFDLEERELGYLGAMGIDVLVTSPTFVSETIGTFFSVFVPSTDMRAMVSAIDKNYPEYKDAARKFFESRFFPPCNVFVMRYELFLEYAAFLFSITAEVDAFYDDLNFCRNDRHTGYLAECLMGIFLMKNKERLKIAYTDMRCYV